MQKKERVLDVRQGELCWVAGTIYMEMPLKPNILEDISKDVSEDLCLVRSCLTRQKALDICTAAKREVCVTDRAGSDNARGRIGALATGWCTTGDVNACYGMYCGSDGH